MLAVVIRRLFWVFPFKGHLKLQGWSYFPFLRCMGSHIWTVTKLHLKFTMWLPIYHPSSVKIYLDYAEVGEMLWHFSSMLTSTKSSPVFEAFSCACYRLECFQLWKTLQEVYYNRFLMWIRNEGNILVVEEHKGPRRVYRTWVLSQGAKGFIHTKKIKRCSPTPM